MRHGNCKHAACHTSVRMACFHYVLVVFAAAVAVRGASGVICKSGEVANDMDLCPCHKAMCGDDPGYYGDDYTYDDNGPKGGEAVPMFVSVRHQSSST